VFSVADTVSKADGGTFDGAVTFGGGVSGVLDADDGITVDNITIDGTEIDLSSGDLTIDSAGDIILDAADSITTPTAGTANVKLGNNAGNSIASGGIRNVTVGDEAGTAITTGTRNVAVGYQALATEDTGSRSIAIGHQALTTQDGGTNDIYNVAVGHNAGGAVTTGVQGVYIGGLAGDADTSGGKNTYVGYNSGTANAGDQNVFIGHSAGSAVTNGDKNTIIGKYDGNTDGHDIRTEDNTVILSDGDGNVRMFVDSGGRVFVSNSGSFKMAVRAKSASGTETMIKFFRLAGGNDTTATSSGQIDTNASDQAVYSTSSDYRLKENVSYEFDATSRLKQLKPARFNFKVTPDETVDGFLAHEVESIIPNAVTGKKDAVDENGDIDPQGIDHGFLVPLLTKTLQEALTRIDTLEAEVKALKGE